MSDRIERRLERELHARAAGVTDDQLPHALSGPALRAEAQRRLTQQIGGELHEPGEPIETGARRPLTREDHRMSIDHHAEDAEHRADVSFDDLPTPRRRRRQLLLASGAAVGVAAAAVIAALVAGSVSPGTQQGPAAHHGHSLPAATHRHQATTASYTYVHGTFSDGYLDVWVPADPITGVWGLKTKSGAPPVVTERARCATFPYFGVAREIGRNPDGSKKVLVKGGVPGCHAGSWNSPYRPPFAASLPTDPTALLADMRRHSGGGSDADTFSLGSNFLAPGWVPKDIASNIVAALKLIPGVQQKRGVPNGAGVSGTLISYTGRVKATIAETFGINVDPASGQVIGTSLAYNGHHEVDPVTRTTVSAIGRTH